MILMAWRKSYPSALGESASCEQIAKFVQSYSPDQLEGLQKPVKGKLFEIYENYHENNDGDNYKSELYEDSNHPKVDLKITDENLPEKDKISFLLPSGERIVDKISVNDACDNIDGNWVGLDESGLGLFKSNKKHFSLSLEDVNLK